MGLKTIQAKHAEAKKELETTIGSFLKDAREINDHLIQYGKKLEEINKAAEEMGALVIKAGESAKKLNTHGIVQLDEVKRLLLVATQHASKPHPIDLTALENLEHAAKNQIEKGLQGEMEQYYEKIAAGWPAEIKVGMMFKNGERVIEITSAQLKSQNPNLKGDEALYHGSSAKSVGDWVGTISTMRPKKAKKTKENDDDGVSSPGWTCRGNPGRFSVSLQAGLLTVKSAVDSIEKAGA